jgi:hypothetical protein
VKPLASALAVVLGASIAGCLDFSEEAYCLRQPTLCVPRAGRISPAYLRAQTPTVMQLQGANFDPDTVVELDGVPLRTIIESRESLRVEVPGLPVGEYGLVARQSFGEAESPRFTVLTPPRLYAVEPEVARPGEIIRLTGRALLSATAVIGGSPAERVTGTDEELAVRVPRLAAPGSTQVVVSSILLADATASLWITVVDP